MACSLMAMRGVRTALVVLVLICIFQVGEPIACPEGQFPCVKDNTCIPDEDVCNGEENCSDGSDEEDCHRTVTINVGLAVGVTIVCFIVCIVIPIAICLVIMCCCCAAVASGGRRRTHVVSYTGPAAAMSATVDPPPYTVRLNEYQPPPKGHKM